jgi:hypothetical protein
LPEVNLWGFGVFRLFFVGKVPTGSVTMIFKSKAVRRALIKRRLPKQVVLRRSLLLAPKGVLAPTISAPIVEGPADPSQTVYLPTGPFADAHSLRARHHLQREHELEHEAQEVPLPAGDYVLDEE